jgi:hypothetical protein
MHKATSEELRQFQVAKLDELVRDAMNQLKEGRERLEKACELWERFNDAGVKVSPGDVYYSRYSPEPVSPEDYPKLRRALGKRTVWTKEVLHVLARDEHNQPTEAKVNVVYYFNAYPGFRFCTHTTFRPTKKCRLVETVNTPNPEAKVLILCSNNAA